MHQCSYFYRNCSLIETVLTVLVMLVSGVGSDVRGRKYFLIWNLTWNMVSMLSLILLSYFSDQILELSFFYIPSIVYGVSGGAFNFFLLSFSYLGDLINKETTLESLTESISDSEDSDQSSDTVDVNTSDNVAVVDDNTADTRSTRLAEKICT